MDSQIPTIVKDTLQAVVDGLTPLAQKLGLAVEQIFWWAIKHNYALALAYSIPTILFTISITKFIKYMKKSDFEYGVSSSSEVLAIVFGVASFILLLVACGTITQAISRWIAPEWNAAQDLVNLIQEAR